MSNDRDERTTGTADRWAARGMAILTMALSIDLIVRILVLKQEPRQWLDIFLIWMGTSLYVFIGMTASGVAPYGGKWSKAWLLILILAVEIPVVLTWMGMVPTWAAFIANMVIAGAGAFLMLMIFRGIYGVWERKTLGRAPREE
jgi:hypothetical protein